MRIQELATAIFAAPEWLRVASMKVETEGEEVVLDPEGLDAYAFPHEPFTLTLDVVPYRSG